ARGPVSRARLQGVPEHRLRGADGAVRGVLGQRGGPPHGARRRRQRHHPPPRAGGGDGDPPSGGLPPRAARPHDRGGDHGGGGGPGGAPGAVFEYEVADRAGALSRGRTQAENAADLILRFREQGRLVLAIRPAAGEGALARAATLALGDSARSTLRRLTSGVGLAALVLFTGQLAAMLGGGLHLVRILTSLAAETTNQKFRKVLTSVRD